MRSIKYTNEYTDKIINAVDKFDECYSTNHNFIFSISRIFWIFSN